MRLFVAVAASLLCFLPGLTAQDKKRVAVMDFDYATVSSSVAAIFGTNLDVGRGVGDLLINKLVEDGKYSVIERSALDVVLKEQNFSNSNRADASSAAQIGKILGVDAIIIGSIHQFGRDDKNTDIGGLGSVAGSFGIGGIGRKKSKAVVGLNARVIDVNTAEILAVAKGYGESKRSSASLAGGGGNWGSGVGGGHIDMGSSNFANTILGEAVTAAVEELAAELEKSADILPEREVNVEGLVADVAGNVLILNVGTNTGLKVGDTLDVRRVVREVKDPATGRVLRTITNKLGVVVITEADEISSVGNFTGDAEVQVGDMVKSP